MNTNPARDATAAVNELMDVTVWLAVSLLPGTHKPFVPPQMSAEKRAEMDATARLENQVSADGNRHTIMPLGESPAPMDLDVMDLLVEILTTADELADLVSDTAKVARMPSADTAFADPVPYLIHVTDLIPACRRHPDVLALITARCESVVFDARSRLGLVSDGQLLPLMCPWCRGRTTGHMFGGARTLRVRLMPLLNTKTGCDEDVPAVVCESSMCSPDEAHYGVTLRGRPAWPIPEWDWLARQIEIAAENDRETAKALDRIMEGLAS